MRSDAFDIVAGARRYTAAKLVADERGDGRGDPLPCAILDDGDDAAAVEASLIENVARLAPDEVTRWDSFTRLVREGRTPEEISATFGIPERGVKRILALGNLMPRIRETPSRVNRGGRRRAAACHPAHSPPVAFAVRAAFLRLIFRENRTPNGVNIVPPRQEIGRAGEAICSEPPSIRQRTDRVKDDGAPPFCRAKS